jgi:type VI secretion system protein ImpA
MSLDIEQLLAPISDEQPCGENLEYDADFGELERAAQPKPDQQYGDTKIEGEEPDWRDVFKRSVELFSRTKDLRVAVYMARAALRTDGLGDFRASLAVIRGMLERYWKELHPQLDPDDDLDPALRINSLLGLCDNDSCLRALIEAPLIDSSLGKTAYRDYMISQGEMPPRSGEEPVESSTIDSAFLDCDAEKLLAVADLAKAALDDASAIESTTAQEVGSYQAPSFDPLIDLLRKISTLLEDRVDRRKLREIEELPNESGDISIDDLSPSEDLAADGDGAPRAAKSRGAALDQVGSRDDVVRLLDKICAYYQKSEPSSPVPMLLRRAKRLVNLDFMSLLRELVPSGVSEAELLEGPSGSSGDNGSSDDS